MQDRTIMLVALLALALAVSEGAGQTSQPSVESQTTTAAAASPAAADGKMIIRRSAEGAPAARSPASSPTSASGSAFDTTRVVLSLAVVLALIFVLRWLSQRLFGGTVTGRTSRAVHVLSRNVISPKQQLLVVQVGRRVVVVGDSGQQMNALCEITDPEEMAALIGQIHEEQRDASGNPFGALFGRAGSAFEKADDEPRASVDVADEEHDAADRAATSAPERETGEELSTLVDKVRLMSRQFRRT